MNVIVNFIIPEMNESILLYIFNILLKIMHISFVSDRAPVSFYKIISKL